VKKLIVTAQARPRLEPEAERLLGLYAERYGRDKRRLNSLLAKGADLGELKKFFIREGLTARHFNALRISLEGERDSRAKSLHLEVAQKKRMIAAIEKRLSKPPEKGGYAPFYAHQKKRRLAGLQSRLESLKGLPHLVFGGRNLWNSQHHLMDNGYTSHADWAKEWRKSRCSEFFLLGSKDETLGNQSCQWNPVTKNMVVRLPDALGGSLEIPHVRFTYGEEWLVDASLRGEAISYRFVRKQKGWYILASAKPPVTETVTEVTRGAIGVDIGPDLVAAVETDEVGNPVSRKTFRLHLYKKSKFQARVIIQEVATKIGLWARRAGKPLSLEILDFEVKKSDLRERGKRYSRMLSAFAYEKVSHSIRSCAAKEGVGIIQVNAAYSSVIGVVKFGALYGLSSDEAAALALARRAMNLMESVPARSAFRRPEDRPKHVWSLWNRFGKAQRSGWRHAFIAARRGPGGRRKYPAFPARAAPA
jgi:hypothetical protein